MRQALTVVVVLVLLGGCYNPELSGPGGFTCEKTGECPSGFNCVNGVCIGPPDPGDVGQRLDVGNGADKSRKDARAPDGQRTDGPKQDQTRLDLPRSDLPVVMPGTCAVLGQPQDISKMNAAPDFSFAVSAKSNAAVSFVSEGASPTLYLLTGTSTSFTTQKLAANVGGSAVGFDSTDKPIVAYSDISNISNSSLKVWFKNISYTVDSNNVGGHVAAGAHGNKDYRYVTYLGNGQLKRALIRVNPALNFTAQTSSVGTPAGVTGGTHLAQGILIVAGTPYTLAYVSNEAKPRVIHSVYYTQPSPTWKHFVLDTIAGIKSQDYGVGIAPVAGGGPPVVWSNTGAGSGFEIRYYLLGKVATIASGARPSYAVAPSSHEAVAYINNGSVEVISRKTAGQGNWTKPLAAFKVSGVGSGASKVIVQGAQNATATTATWELVYRLSGNMTKLRRLYHVSVTCKY
jgi:hypothetical protein